MPVKKVRDSVNWRAYQLLEVVRQPSGDLAVTGGYWCHLVANEQS